MSLDISDGLLETIELSSLVFGSWIGLLEALWVSSRACVGSEGYCGTEGLCGIWGFKFIKSTFPEWTSSKLAF